MFETTGTINKDILKEIKKHSLPLSTKLFLYGFSISFIYTGIFWLLNGEIDFGSRGLLIGTLLLIFTYFVMKQPSKLMLKRFKESYGKEEMNVKVHFEENNVVINNLENNAIEHMNYTVFRKFKETKNTFILLSKSYQFVLIFKDCLDADSQYDFKKFISNKCKLKVKL